MDKQLVGYTEYASMNRKLLDYIRDVSMDRHLLLCAAYGMHGCQDTFWASLSICEGIDSLWAIKFTCERIEIL